jgi:AraC-like DNA-binding protein
VEPTLERADLRYWRIDPDPRLRPRVLCYFVALPAASATIDAPASRAELLLPDGYSEIVFSLANRFERCAVGECRPREEVQASYLIGGRSHSVVTRALGDLRIIGVKLESQVLRNMIQTPLSEFRDATLSLRDLNDKALLDLEDAVANVRGVEQVAAQLDSFFLQRRASLHCSDTLVTRLIERIRAQAGNVAIRQWLRSFDIDPRSFERRFCAWTGMMPKRFARIARFNRSYAHLLRGEAARGALGLHLADYYDQSHFHRDFKYFTGASPAASLNEGMDITEHLLEVM